VGAITDSVRRYVPATYRAMVEATSPTAKYFTTSDLQALADYVKFRLFSTVVDESQEATAYNPHVRQFLGKLTTIQYIPAAIDYWDAQLASKTITGTNEVAAYRDHREGLIHLLEELSRQVADEWLELAPEYGFTISRSTMVPRVSYGDNGRGVLITPDPQEFPAMDSYEASPSDWLPWRVNV
jgi:cell fate (sporulation/competence/biofilm development) regulator YlbF (YheA/YmcA/DUF963 family)